MSILVNRIFPNPTGIDASGNLCPLSHRLAVRQPVMNSAATLRPVAVILQRFPEPVAARRGIQAKKERTVA
jgi:hypothetical protein